MIAADTTITTPPEIPRRTFRVWLRDQFSLRPPHHRPRFRVHLHGRLYRTTPIEPTFFGLVRFYDLETDAGTYLPTGFGVAWRSHMHKVDVLMPLHINVVAHYLRRAYFWVIDPGFRAHHCEGCMERDREIGRLQRMINDARH